MRRGNFIWRRKCLKQLFYGHFLEDAHAEDLENFVERSVCAQAFFEDSHQRIDAHRDPELSADRVATGAVKDLDPQMLLEPTKEQFDLPALLVELCYGQSRQSEVIGQKHERAPMFPVVKAHPPQFVGVGSDRAVFLQADDVVAAQARGFVHRLVVESATGQVFACAHDEPGAGLFDGIKPPPSGISTVHQVKGSGFPSQLIEPEHILEGGQTDQQLGGQSRMQFQLRVNFQTGTLRIETRPGIDRQAQVDDAGIQGVNRLCQIQRQGLLGVKPARLSDQVLGQIGENAPVAAGQSIGQSAAFDRAAQTQVIELLGTGIETGLYVAQTLAPRQLGEDQTDKLLPGGEVLDFVIAAVTLDATVKLLAMEKIQKLSKDVLARIHGSRITANRSFAATLTSNRSHPVILSFAP